ncbi:hypothetical protein EGC86_02210 [Shewanella frigidimarina]|uniref:hypothetical protein n=1 Tax=Shewanella frigidimarina TaxID=56812 RepID=UPI000F50FFB2|nr:hypothetical protein [Shewanella frigidimarina]RPA64107.1 hypothetical protein EGC86_02210 [Shewanella frigidimarina]
MKLIKTTSLLLLCVLSPLVLAGQKLIVDGAKQSQVCYSSLINRKNSISTLNKTTTIDTCLQSNDPTKQIIINCQPSNTLSIEGVDKVKLANDMLAANMFASCLEEVKASGQIMTSQDNKLLTQLTSTIKSEDTINRWISSFELGYKHQNGYDEEGNRTGFDQGGITGSLKLNGRWKNSWGWSDAVTNFEVGVVFEQYPTVNEDKPDPEVSEFNDVTDAIDGYLKFLYSPGHFMATEDGDSVLSFAVLAGVRSLDEASPGNELARYYGGGLEFNLYSMGFSKYQNGLPRARVGTYFVRTSNYGVREDVNVWVIQAQYQLVEDKPFLLGFNANLGPDDLDDYSVTLSVRQDTAKLMSFFGFISE